MVNDPVADMLTRMRNAIMVGHASVDMPSSTMKVEIARVLKEEGFIESYEVVDGEKAPQKVLQIKMKYSGERRNRKSVITGIERVSRPGRRVYTGKNNIPWILFGMGITIMSTPKGVMTGYQARQQGLGGEILAKVW